MAQKKNIDLEKILPTANRFGIPVWTGKDVENFRKDFAPKGKRKMSFDDLAELIGFNHRSQAKRLEDQEFLSPSISIALEYIKRLLTEERNGYFVDWKNPNKKDADNHNSTVLRQNSSIKIDVREGIAGEKEILATVYLSKPSTLEISGIDGTQTTALHRLSLE